MLGIV
jgi:hypothetical protein